MSNKTIKIQEILVDKSLLEWASFCLVTGLHEHSGYYVVAANNQVFVEKSWWDNEDETETLALVNDHDLNREAKREATVSFDVDTVEEKDIPVFGVTIDGNYNIQQFNLAAEEIADDAALDSLFNSAQKPVYWDIDKNLHVGQNQYPEEQFKEYIDAVKTQGYANPIVLYVDGSFVRTYYYDLIPYLYHFLGCKTLPIRVITYKDFKYVEAISPAIYNAIKSVPANPYYAPEDEEDVSSFMVSNFSDKRDILKDFVKHTILSTDQRVVLMDLARLDEVLPYFFFDKMEAKNKEYIDALLQHTYPEHCAFEDDHFADSMSINEAIYRYLMGYAPISDAADINDITADVLVKKEDIAFDPALYPIDSFSYIDYAESNKEENKRRNAIIKKFGNNVVYDQYPNQLLEFQCLTDLLADSKKKVRVLKKAE